MSEKATVLVLDDDEGLRTQYRWLLSQFNVLTAETRPEAVTIFERERPALAIVDLGLPPDPDGASEGLAALTELHRIDPEAKFLVVTGNENREYALKAVGAGAYDFFEKPVDPNLLSLVVDRALRLHALEQENKQLIAEISQSPVAEIVTGSPQMLQILKQVERIAKTDIVALILGESGTGKELIARAIHSLGPRSAKSFVAINCSAIPEGLLEAELFGHEKGAFTGAIKQTIGRIESADEGTLFLDEIGDIPMAMQVKLLRFLQNHVIERVGGRAQIKVDTRIVCATNQDLTKRIADGQFREDLYYRINEVTLRIPPLRERQGDAILLANFFLKKYARLFKLPLRGFSSETVAAIGSYPWNGNVRELENRVKRATVMADGVLVKPQDLDLEAPQEIPKFTLREARRRAEREVLDIVLADAQGNMAKAAKLLEVSRPTLYDLLREHGLSPAGRATARADSKS